MHEVIVVNIKKTRELLLPCFGLLGLEVRSLVFYFYFYFICLYVCMHMWVWYLQRPDHTRSPGVGVIGGCELLDVILGTELLVSSKSHKCSQLLSLLSRLRFLACIEIATCSEFFYVRFWIIIFILL